MAGLRRRIAKVLLSPYGGPAVMVGALLTGLAADEYRRSKLQERLVEQAVIERARARAAAAAAPAGTEAPGAGVRAGCPAAKQ